jgi:hypothetical protein
MSSDEITIKDAKLVWSEIPSVAQIDTKTLQYAYQRARYFEDCTFEEFVKILQKSE